MPPVTSALWSGIRKADKFGPVCPQRLPDIKNETAALERMSKGRLEYLKRLFQHLQNQSEDCLYLNIYAPILTSNTKLADKGPMKYPVMVFVHGESYEWNSGNPYEGAVLASFGQILVVTINYRLGILGFLNANTNRYLKSPANYGLMDIIAALHWIQENISSFGGDPGSVTLAGHGTGAACVHFLISSSAVPEGLLFHRAILMSGSGLAPWSLVGDPARQAAIVSHHVKCSPDLPHGLLMKCLREKPLAELLATPVRSSYFSNSFGPTVDGVVIDSGDSASGESGQEDFKGENSQVKLTQHPRNTLSIINSVLLHKQAISKLTRYDLMTGVTRAESYFSFNSEDVQYGIEADRRSKILRTYVKNTYSFHLNEILATIVNEYTDWERPVQHPINIRDETMEALSDAQIVAPISQTANIHSADHRNSFLYVFEYQSKFGDYPQRQGCIHGEDLPYVFGAPLVGGFSHFPRNYTKAEIALSEAVMLYWTNFIRTGNPNEQQDLFDGKQEKLRIKNIEWFPYDTVHKKFLNLDLKPKLKNHYRAHRLSFWLNLVPDLHKPGSGNVPAAHHQLEDDDWDAAAEAEATIKPLSPPQERGPMNYSIFTTQVFSLFNLSAAPANGKMVRANKATAAETADAAEDAQQGTAAPQEDGFAAYSTALSVTIAIGCSLLILNVLIFAGVYYQRDKTRSQAGGGGYKKRSENGKVPNNICGDLDGTTIHLKSDPTAILTHHHVMQHQLPPLDCIDGSQRAPPPPKYLKSFPENAMLAPNTLQLLGRNLNACDAAVTVKSSLKQTNSDAAQVDELRV
ncbi:neuroligin-1 [Phlebotomus argentipes]|uniref:neuroligin-1 n=1 Tax=Phlebotomus argentipes TaxID=94469 RepID=UPI00289350A5|nr:neuroligin-1 [Phlebotomus argentipes]